MIATIVILAVSAGLFIYWFRYSCALILSTKTTLNYSTDVAEKHGLSFPVVQDSLAAVPYESLVEYARRLSDDYATVSEMLKQTASTGEDSYQAECSLLLVNFHCMSALFHLAGRASTRLARLTICEMSQIVEYHANLAGEHMLSASRPS